MVMTGREEPYEVRVSRTVLRGPLGGVPEGYSTCGTASLNMPQKTITFWSGELGVELNRCAVARLVAHNLDLIVNTSW